MDYELSPGAVKFALVMLAHVNYATGVCWRAMNGLADQLKRSRRSVARYRAELEHAGLLVRKQLSGRQCNRFMAVIPRIAAPKTPPVSDPMAESIDLQKKMATQGCHVDLSAITPEKKEHSQLGAPAQREAENETSEPAVPSITHQAPQGGAAPLRGAGNGSASKGRGSAPSGFEQRGTVKAQMSPDVEQARHTMRRLGIRETIVGYLVLTCSPDELQWLAASAVVADNPARYVRSLYNRLAMGLASPYRTQRRADKYIKQPRQEGDMSNTAASEAPAVPQPQAISRVDPPGLYWDRKAWSAAWDALPSETKQAAQAAALPPNVRTHLKSMSGEVADRTRRRRLSAALFNLGAQLAGAPAREHVPDHIWAEWARSNGGE